MFSTSAFCIREGRNDRTFTVAIAMVIIFDRNGCGKVEFTMSDQKESYSKRGWMV